MTTTHEAPAARGTVTTCRLGRDEVAAATTVLERSFAEEPGNLALYPDPTVRAAVLRLGAGRAVQDTVRHATAHGALVDGSLGAVALWHPPGTTMAAGPADIAGVLAEAAGQLPTFARGLPRATATVASHPASVARLVQRRRRAVHGVTDGPAWHLAFLGTVPEHRGHGLARRLLERQLRRCDEDALPAWLETTDPVNPPLYARFGFEVVTHVTDAAWLPGWWLMRRDPTPT